MHLIGVLVTLRRLARFCMETALISTIFKQFAKNLVSCYLIRELSIINQSMFETFTDQEI